MTSQAMPNRGVSIKQAALLSGLSETTLRYYETIGIIPFIERDSQSKHRKYSEADVEYLVAIARLNAIGMPIADIKMYFQNRPKGQAVADEQVSLFTKQVDRIDEEIKRLHLQRDYAAGKINYWQAVQLGDKEKLKFISKSNNQIGAKLSIKKEKYNDK